MTGRDEEQVLRGVRVVDLTETIAGAYCTKLLADSGADVIKVERPPEGDALRKLGPFPGDEPDPEKSGAFLYFNGNKRSIVLDYFRPAGCRVLKRLLAESAVLVEHGRPGHLEEYGLSFEQLRGDLPHLIYASLSPFGQTGPYRNFRGNSLTAMAVSSIMYVTGDPDREPLTTGCEAAELFTGVMAWLAILVALEDDAGSGGQHVDVAMSEALMPAEEYNTAMYAYQGAIRRRYYSRHVFGYPMDILPCQDGHVAVIPGAAGFPTRMAILLEQPELEEHELFTSALQRSLRWREFDSLVEPWLARHQPDEIVERAQSLRMPFAPVPTTRDLLENEHLAQRGHFIEVEHPEAGRLIQPGAPVRMSDTPFTSGPAPTLGQHTAEVLAELGYDEQDIGLLNDSGAV